MPFGLMSIATQWRNNGNDVRIVDSRLGDRIEDFLDDSVEMLGVTCMTGTAINDAVEA